LPAAATGGWGWEAGAWWETVVAAHPRDLRPGQRHE